MTEDEITRHKYLILRNNLVNIDNELKNLLDAHDNIVSMLGVTFIINNEMIEHEAFERIKSNILNVDTEITMNLIPAINDKIS